MLKADLEGTTPEEHEYQEAEIPLEKACIGAPCVTSKFLKATICQRHTLSIIPVIIQLLFLFGIKKSGILKCLKAYQCLHAIIAAVVFIQGKYC